MVDIENSPFYSIFEQFTSKSKCVIWKNWDEEGIVELDNVALYDKLSKNAQNFTSNIKIKYKKMEEEFVPGSNICLLYVKGKNYLQVRLETQLLH